MGFVWILDEAHAAPEEVAGYLSRTVTPRQIEELALTAPHGTTMADWTLWARDNLRGATGLVAGLTEDLRESPRDGPRIQGPLTRAKATLRTIERLATAAPDQWIVTSTREGHEFHPLDVGPHVEGALLHGIKKVVLTSATLTKKTVEALGMDPGAVA